MAAPRQCKNPGHRPSSSPPRKGHNECDACRQARTRAKAPKLPNLPTNATWLERFEREQEIAKRPGPVTTTEKRKRAAEGEQTRRYTDGSAPIADLKVESRELVSTRKRLTRFEYLAPYANGNEAAVKQEIHESKDRIKGLEKTIYFPGPRANGAKRFCVCERPIDERRGRDGDLACAKCSRLQVVQEA